METIYKETEARMTKTIDAVQHELSQMRTGRASLALLDGIHVDCYGTKMPLNQVATMSVPEVRLINIQPWDKASFDPIIKSIQSSSLGLNPQSDGKIIRLPIPQPTEERRKELIKLVKKKVEEGRVSIRNTRRESNDKIKLLLKNKDITEDDEKNSLSKIQKLTDDYIEKINNILEKKEKEIETI